jgi:hypothetical protein
LLCETIILWMIHLGTKCSIYNDERIRSYEKYSINKSNMIDVGKNSPIKLWFNQMTTQ